MPRPVTAVSRRMPRRRPFGVLAICALLILQTVVLGIAVVALATASVGSETGEMTLTLWGFDLRFASDEVTMQRVVVAVLGAITVGTLVQVVLLLALKRVGWVITMLLVGLSLAAQLYAAWRGQPTSTISLLIDAITALYLNQSDVRKAFGVSAGRIDAALGRSADAVVGAALGDDAAEEAA